MAMSELETTLTVSDAVSLVMFSSLPPETVTELTSVAAAD
jgi:hypothetical protein